LALRLKRNFITTITVIPFIAKEWNPVGGWSAMFWLRTEAAYQTKWKSEIRV
jgi:hypothetical protein